MKTPKEIYIHAFNEGLNEGLAGGTPPDEDAIAQMADEYLEVPPKPSWLPSNKELDEIERMPDMLPDEESQDDSITDFPTHWDGPELS